MMCLIESTAFKLENSQTLYSPRRQMYVNPKYVLHIAKNGICAKLSAFIFAAKCLKYMMFRNQFMTVVGCFVFVSHDVYINFVINNYHSVLRVIMRSLSISPTSSLNILKEIAAI